MYHHKKSKSEYQPIVNTDHVNFGFKLTKGERIEIKLILHFFSVFYIVTRFDLHHSIIWKKSMARGKVVIDKCYLWQ